MDEVGRWLAEQQQQGVLWLTEAGTVAFCNPAATSLVGLKVGEDFAPTVADWEALWSSLGRAAEQGHLIEFITSGRSVEATVSHAPSGLGLFVRDPTAEQDLQDELMRLASFPEFNPNPVLEVGLDLEVSYVNESGLDEVGAVVDAVENREGLLELGRTGGVARVEVSSGPKVFQVTAHGLPEWGVVRCYLQDVTSRREALAALKRAHDGLERRVQDRTAQLAIQVREREAAERKAIDASRAKSTFLANMSHELRTPLNGILGYAELLLEEIEEEPEVVADLEKIVRAGRHLLSLISDVLDLAKVEAGKMDVVLGEVALTDLLLEVVEAMEPLAGESALVAELSQLPTVRTDGGKLKQVMLNLVGNACKFTDGGQITVEGRVVEGVVELAVRDTGIGISASRLEAIFEPFTQEKETTAVDYGGTGLGLALCRELMHLLGGTLGAGSVVGVGSRFVVRLPLSSVA